MENKSHALAAGFFVLIVSSLLVGLALWLTRDSANVREYELSSKEGVSGLQPQAVVRYKGVAVGKVARIGFDPEAKGHVLIRIAVNEQAPISPTTFATFGYQGVTGLAHVLLDDAATPFAPLAPGVSGLPRLWLKPSPLGRIAEQAPAILARVEESTRRINQLLGDDNQQRIRDTLEQIRQASASANTLVQRLDTVLVQRLDPALAALPPLAGEARQTLQALQQAGASVAGMASQIGQTTQRLNAEGGALDQITQGSQSLARAADLLGQSTLPRVNRVAEDAARAARQWGRTAVGVNDNPQLFLYGPGRASAGPGEPGFEAPRVQP